MVTSTRSEPAHPTPWQLEKRAVKRLGLIRKSIVLNALDGNLPTEEMRSEHERAAAELQAIFDERMAQRPEKGRARGTGRAVSRDDAPER